MIKEKTKIGEEQYVAPCVEVKDLHVRSVIAASNEPMNEEDSEW